MGLYYENLELEKRNDMIRVLWTGGWDSTYRMVELSFLDVSVQPVYVIDPGRGSREMEQKSMNNILDSLREKEHTRAKFLPVLEVKLEDVPVINEITEAYNRISEEIDLGIQHDWLSRLSTIYPMTELCIENILTGHRPVRESINKYGKLIQTPEGYIIDNNNSSKDIQLLFGNQVLPIFDLTESEMVENIKKWGYEDVMSLIWFCHTPIKGKPCGMCNPCFTKIGSGMEFLMNKDALKRNKRVSWIIDKFGDKRLAKYYRGIHHRLDF